MAEVFFFLSFHEDRISHRSSGATYNMHYPHPSHVHMPFLPPVCSVTERRTAVERGGEKKRARKKELLSPRLFQSEIPFHPDSPSSVPFFLPRPITSSANGGQNPSSSCIVVVGRAAAEGKEDFFVPPLPQIRESGKRRGAEKESGKSRGGDTSDISLPLPDTHTGEMSSSFTTSTSVSPSSPAPPPSSQD